MSTADCTQENRDTENPVTVQTAPAQGLGLNTALSVQKIYLVPLIQTSAAIIQQRESETSRLLCLFFFFSSVSKHLFPCAAQGKRQTD